MAAKKPMTDAQFGASIRNKVIEAVDERLADVIYEVIDIDGLDALYAEVEHIVQGVVKTKDVRTKVEKKVEEALQDDKFFKELILDAVRRK